MLDALVSLCTSESGLITLRVWADALIALAYFTIPVSMLWVFRRRKVDLPYPWLWVAFVVFIFSCGLTHLAHVAAAWVRSPLLDIHAALGLITAAASIATALALTFALPQIDMLPSPQAERKRLEAAIRLATMEKDALLRELNHRVGNQLATLGAVVRREIRNSGGGELTAVRRIEEVLEQLGEEHHRLAALDYSPEHPARNFVDPLLRQTSRD